MPTELLPLGPVTLLVQNQIYALPAVRCLLFTADTTVGIQQSNVVGFTTSTTVSLTGGQAEVAGGFIRCTSSTTCSITLKRA